MLIGSRQSTRSLPPFRVPLEPRPLPSTGITPLPRYYVPLRHPAGPKWPSRVFGGRVRATDRASRVASASPARTSSTPAETTVLFRSRPLAVPVAGSRPRDSGGPASVLTVSRPARRSLALRPARSLSRPRRPFSTEVLQSISLPPRTAPIAIGWNEQLAGRVYPRWGARPHDLWPVKNVKDFRLLSPRAEAVGILDQSRSDRFVGADRTACARWKHQDPDRVRIRPRCTLRLANANRDLC